LTLETGEFNDEQRKREPRAAVHISVAFGLICRSIGYSIFQPVSHHRPQGVNGGMRVSNGGYRRSKNGNHFLLNKIKMHSRSFGKTEQGHQQRLAAQADQRPADGAAHLPSSLMRANRKNDIRPGLWTSQNSNFFSVLPDFVMLEYTPTARTYEL
jgi:hypothetical protein